MTKTLRISRTYSLLRGLLTVGLIGQSVLGLAQYPGQSADKMKVPVNVPIKAQSFDLQDVRITHGLFHDNIEREGKWLLSLPVDRLMHSFRVNAGMNTPKPGSPTKMPKPLGGWEGLDMELRGHSIGHMLSGLALQYASTGRDAFRKKGDSLVTALADVQRVLNQNGYLSAYPQQYIDRNIAGTAVWAPWYTLHKLFAGLTDQFTYAGNQQALDIVTKMASWASAKLSPLTPEQRQKMLRNEFGGMNDAFFNLYAVTGNPEHLKLAQFFYHKAALEPLENGQDNLDKAHANTFIPKLVGEARDYELTGNEKAKTAALFFWKTVVQHHTYAHGGNSDKEHFFEPDQLSKHLTGNTSETCNTYNMLKLTRHLFTWSADATVADYYEQALYNHILGQQDPESGMVCYFTPMKAGAYRLYSTPDQSFWCCVGSGFESQSKYGEAIYYHDDKGVYINLFIPSEVSWKQKGVTLVQETNYPEEATTRLTVQTKTPVQMPLYLRYPAWATAGVTLKVNGKAVAVKQSPGSYITVERSWKEGDRIELTYPMALRLVPTNDDPTVAAIAYGPIVLAGQLGTANLKGTAPFHDPANPYQYYGYDYTIPDSIDHTLTTGGKPITDWLKPVSGKPLTFQTVAMPGGKPVELVPYYRTHRQRYVVYWDLK
ncbi:glycoside hydrolase family 127 protein [Fibrivirga algicola]|uniref:Glycoside hydrolase family 127 protein n=1 Tax=Fibrivirga algicola TaxID=2950420 RepID=A0ABX0QQM5_9BACT|nr:glycoside hydrolase family 127 protein [Fibrivirga algicola]NID13455.1 glycoside hydrolase family 127 protein [Fibrivirga algicola]